MILYCVFIAQVCAARAASSSARRVVSVLACCAAATSIQTAPTAPTSSTAVSNNIHQMSVCRWRHQAVACCFLYSVTLATNTESQQRYCWLVAFFVVVKGTASKCADIGIGVPVPLLTHWLINSLPCTRGSFEYTCT